MRTALIFFVGMSLPFSTFSQSLAELYKLAEAQSETVGSKEALIQQAEARYWQAIGSVLPRLKIAGSYTWQEDIPSGLGGNLHNWKVSGTQPLFKGLREYFGLFQAKRLVASENYGKKYEVLKLREQVAARYFKLRSLEAELESFSEGELSLQKRVAELKQRVQTGRSKKSDVLSAEASLENLRSQMSLFRAQREIEWENLSFLTGLTKEPKGPSSFSMPDLPDEKAALELADFHPRVLSEKEKAEASRNNRMMSWGEHLPTADLSANYYLQRTGSLRDIEWDLKLDLSIPIFEGGTTQARIREAQAKERQALLEFQKARRETHLSIKTDLENLKSRREELTALEKAVKFSEGAYQEQSRQYDLGLVSNLDVLSSLSSFYDTKRSYDRSFFELQFLAEKLKQLQEVSR